MIEVRLKPVETLLFRGDVVAIGKFRCPATHPLFRDSGPCSHHTFVFPRAITQIHHAGGPTFTGSPATVALYNQHQLYTRTRISDVDASDWYTLADDVLFELVGRVDDPARPFRVAHVPVDAKSYAEQRMLFDALDAGAAIDPLQVEETVLRLLARVVGGLDRMPPRDADAIEHARHVIAVDPTRGLSLRAIARMTGLSPYRLCRSFRAHTGTTMTHYRHALRLRLALDRLRERVDLTELALDLGYSSHSHFTAVFRRHFGLTPSQFRDSATAAARRMLRACDSC